ncbi:hypothetical protein [Paenibacillus lutrae]|uniref:Uncharacterized protein n=1 Tax=Paenibacillus lutrae TaxID=2078573 RepID=A0A7X3K1F2_9BACL|nr:hypothetical protein [Paenibacillus lutrae]MVP01911.1 hypothetical protein [Paenibacillus lutrae]
MKKKSTIFLVTVLISMFIASNINTGNELIAFDQIQEIQINKHDGSFSTNDQNTIKELNNTLSDAIFVPFFPDTSSGSVAIRLFNSGQEIGRVVAKDSIYIRKGKITYRTVLTPDLKAFYSEILQENNIKKN